MGSEESNDLLKGVDWKTVGNAGNNSNGVPVIKKRLSKKIRHVPDYYFLPRRSLSSAIVVYGGIIAAGVGAGMLIEVWINKKIKGCSSWTLAIYLYLCYEAIFGTEFIYYDILQRMEVLYGSSINNCYWMHKAFEQSILF